MAERVAEPVTRYLSRARIRTALPYFVYGLLLVAVLDVSGREITHHVEAMESWVAARGRLGVLVYVGAFVLATSLLFPEEFEAWTRRPASRRFTEDALRLLGPLL